MLGRWSVMAPPPRRVGCVWTAGGAWAVAAAVAALVSPVAEVAPSASRREDVRRSQHSSFTLFCRAGAGRLCWALSQL